MVADFAKRELADTAFKSETEEQYHVRLGKLGAQGLLGMTAPVEHGGGGLSYFDALLAVEEMAKHDPRSAGEMHTNGTGTAATSGCSGRTSSRSAGCGRSARGGCAARSR